MALGLQLISEFGNYFQQIGFDQDGLSSMSFEKGFGPATQQWPWNLDRPNNQLHKAIHLRKIGTFLAIVSITGVPGEKLFDWISEY